jgi:hypothetical protein
MKQCTVQETSQRICKRTCIIQVILQYLHTVLLFLHPVIAVHMKYKYTVITNISKQFNTKNSILPSFLFEFALDCHELNLLRQSVPLLPIRASKQNCIW